MFNFSGYVGSHITHFILKVMSLTSHPYKTKSQTFDGSSDTSSTTTSVATSENITNLETKLLSRFDELTKELLNVKDVIIKNLQAQNERLREKSQ